MDVAATYISSGLTKKKKKESWVLVYFICVKLQASNEQYPAFLDCLGNVDLVLQQP